MRVRTNTDGLIRTTNRIASQLPNADKAGVKAAAGVVRDSVLSAARAKRAKPTPGWVKVTPRNSGSSSSSLVELRSARAYWAERGTKAHTIAPKRKKAVLTPYGPRARVRVRGATARPFWRNGVESSKHEAVKAYADHVAGPFRGR